MCAAWVVSVSKYCGESLELLVCDSNQPNLESSSLSWLLATSQRLPYFARVSARPSAQGVGQGEGTRKACALTGQAVGRSSSKWLLAKRGLLPGRRQCRHSKEGRTRSWCELCYFQSSFCCYSLALTGTCLLPFRT